VEDATLGIVSQEDFTVAIFIVSRIGIQGSVGVPGGYFLCGYITV
jgi:hypothetical protein